MKTLADYLNASPIARAIEDAKRGWTPVTTGRHRGDNIPRAIEYMRRENRNNSGIRNTHKGAVK